MNTLHLKELLTNIDEIDWDLALYVRSSEKLSLDAKCIVLDPEETEDPDGSTYEFAIDSGFTYCLSIADIQDIKSNACQQLENPTVDSLFEAVLYYIENDAFITFDLRSQ